MHRLTENVSFETFSKENHGRFPSALTKTGADGKPPTAIEPVKDGSNIQSIFFGMWRQDHPDDSLQNVPGDLVTTSGSGLGPDTTLENAEDQLDRADAKWAANTKQVPSAVRSEIDQILQAHAKAPFGGLAGGKLAYVLEVNLELRKRYGAPNQSAHKRNGLYPWRSKPRILPEEMLGFNGCTEIPKIFRNSSSLLPAFSMSSLGSREYAFPMFISTDSEKPAELKGGTDPAQTSSAVHNLTRLERQLLEKVRILEERISSLEARQPAPPLPSQTPIFSVGASSRSAIDLESLDGR